MFVAHHNEYLKFPGKTYFVIREKYTPYVYHGEQEQGMEPMCVNVHCIRDFDDGDS